MKRRKLLVALVSFSAAILVAWTIGITHSSPSPTVPLHEMMGHAMAQPSDATPTCQVGCATVALGFPKTATDTGRLVTQPEPLNLRYMLLLLVILLPLAVTVHCVFLSSSWRPPDIPLLTGMYSVSF